MLRPGNVHSAHGWRDVLDPVVARYRGQNIRRPLRGDVAFALPDVYEYLEAEGFQYAIRLPANQVLQAQILVLPAEVAQWSLTSLREKVVKVGAKVIAHGRYLVFQTAEVAVPRELFRRLLDRIARLRPPAVARC